MGAIVVRQPVGVVACITPYNFPIVNMAGKIGPALAMGNTVVVKPAPQDPLAVTVFGEVLHEAGFPAGRGQRRHRLRPRVGPGARGLEARRHGQLHRARPPSGRPSARWPGRDMKRLLLELGGKGAGIVFDDADLKTAIATIASVWAFHSGQICTAPTRVIAQRGVYDQVVAGPAAGGRAHEGRRPARARHGGRPAHLRRAARAGRGPRPGRRRAGRRARGRRRPPRPGDRLLRRSPRSSPAASPTTRPCSRSSSARWWWSSRSTTRTRPSPSPTAPSSASTTTSSPPTPARAMRVARQLRTGNVGHQHGPAQPRGAVRRLQDVRRRPRRRQLRPPRLQRAPEHRLARLTAGYESVPRHFPGLGCRCSWVDHADSRRRGGACLACWLLAAVVLGLGPRRGRGVGRGAGHGHPRGLLHQPAHPDHPAAAPQRVPAGHGLPRRRPRRGAPAVRHRGAAGRGAPRPERRPAHPDHARRRPRPADRASPAPPRSA